MTQKYVKNPIQIEAVQFTYTNKDQVYHWARSIQMNVTHSWDENRKPILIIPTAEGEMVCSLGDYVVVEPFPTADRKLYPVKQAVFAKTYMKL
jgi:hypothetical protein